MENTKKNKKILIIVGGIILLIFVVVIIISFSHSSEKQSNQNSPALEENNLGDFSQTSKAQEVVATGQKELTKPVDSLLSDTKGTRLNIYDIHITEKGFDIPELIVAKGTIVQMNITNKTDTSVDILSQEMGLYSSPVIPESTANVSVDASKMGNFEVTCYKLCPAGVKLLGKLVIR